MIWVSFHPFIIKSFMTLKAKNPIIVSLLMLCGGISAHAATYYVSSTSGNDSYTSTQAQSMATPWKTIGKVNSFFASLNPGDTVKLQCGSSFNQELNITKSGTSAKQIVITSYGSGYAPVITGFALLTGWGGGSGNIWQTTCPTCGAGSNMVKEGNVAQPMGRWPNTWSNSDAGYAQIQSYNGTVSITDAHIGASGKNWTGSKIVIRKNRWVIENDTILSQSGNTITYRTGTVFTPANKFGYFIQGHPGTLDQQGEWYYNPANKVVQIYSVGSPAALNVQISRVDTLLNCTSVQYVTVNGIEFDGANKVAICIFRSNYVTVQNCSVKYSGLDAVEITTCNYLNFNNIRTDYTNNNGFMAYCNNSTIQNCIIQRTAAIPGMNLPVNSGMGIYLVGNGNTIAYNTIDTVGYSGICFQGVSNNVTNNYVNYFCFVKDDGGGIYTWNGATDSTDTHTAGAITNNIVTNGMTAPAGTDSSVAGIAHGIYLDENTSGCTVTGNTVAHCTAGVFVQDIRNCSIRNNTLFDCIGQLVMRHALSTGAFSGDVFSGNYCVTKLDTQYICEVSSPISPVGKIASYISTGGNHYAQLASGSYFYLFAMTDFFGKGPFGSWQSTYHEDASGSNNLPINFLPYTINSYIGSNKYTKGNIVTPFLTGAVGSRVITSAAVGSITSGAYYVLSYTMVSPDAAHTMLNFLEEGVSPYPQLSAVTSTATAKPSSVNTIIWQATGSYSNALLVFQLSNNVQALSVSNISLYQANVTANNPANNYIFQVNPSKSAMKLALSGTYQDAAGATYTSSVTIPAYGSVILIKKS